MPVSREARAGCNAGFARIWVSMSGDALIRSQSSPLTLMHKDDWVRACAWIVPRRKPLQFGQLQFHCGKPPPAAEPSIFNFI